MPRGHASSRDPVSPKFCFHLSRDPVGVVIDNVDGDVGVPMRYDLLFDALCNLCLLFLSRLSLSRQQVGSLQVHLLLVPAKL